MKTSLFCALLVLVFLAMGMVSINAGEEPKKDEPKAKLQLTITINQKVFKPKEQFVLTVEWKNIGNEKIVIGKMRKDNPYMKVQGEYQYKSTQRTDNNTLDKTPIELEPGKSVTATISGNWSEGASSTGGYGGTSYQYLVFCDDERILHHYQGKHKLVLITKLQDGTEIKSNELEFEITDAIQYRQETPPNERKRPKEIPEAKEHKQLVNPGAPKESLKKDAPDTKEPDEKKPAANLEFTATINQKVFKPKDKLELKFEWKNTGKEKVGIQCNVEELYPEGKNTPKEKIVIKKLPRLTLEVKGKIQEFIGNGMPPVEAETPFELEAGESVTKTVSASWIEKTFLPGVAKEPITMSILEIFDDNASTGIAKGKYVIIGVTKLADGTVVKSNPVEFEIVDDAKPEEKKPDEKKADEKKPDAKKADEKKPVDNFQLTATINQKQFKFGDKFELKVANALLQSEKTKLQAERNQKDQASQTEPLPALRSQNQSDVKDIDRRINKIDQQIKQIEFERLNQQLNTVVKNSQDAQNAMNNQTLNLTRKPQKTNSKTPDFYSPVGAAIKYSSPGQILNQIV